MNCLPKQGDLNKCHDYVRFQCHDLYTSAYFEVVVLSNDNVLNKMLEMKWDKAS